jgi:hypothetical protein
MRFRNVRLREFIMRSILRSRFSSGVEGSGVLRSLMADAYLSVKHNVGAPPASDSGRPQGAPDPAPADREKDRRGESGDMHCPYPETAAIGLST